MTTLVFCLEEPSAKAMLENLLPKITTRFDNFFYIVFEGKQDMEKQLVRKIKFWQKPDSQFLILRDQDSALCLEVKQQIQQLCIQAGRPDAIIRIACRELESFYIGDLMAVEKAFSLNGLHRQQGNRKFRTPDQLNNAKQELKKLTKNKYQEISGSREIAKYMDVDNNKSHSFQTLINSIKI